MRPLSHQKYLQFAALDFLSVSYSSSCSCSDGAVIMSQGFTLTQLRYFSVTQAAVITQSQYQSLDAAKQELVRQKLSTIQSDLLSDPTEGGNAGKHVAP